MKKTLKKRAFISAIAMLIVSAIVLTSSTFAWFAMATEVSVDSMELNITSLDGIVFSANTTNWTTKLTKDDFTNTQSSSYRYGAYAGNYNNFPTSLTPSSSSCYPVGQYPFFYAGSIDDSGIANITAVSTSQTSCAGDVGSGYVAFDLFIKLAEPKTVKWTASLGVKDGDPEDCLYAMRVGVDNCGLVGEKADAATILAKKATKVADMVVWEIDNTKHVATAGVDDGVTAVTKAVAAPVTSFNLGTKHVVDDSRYTKVLDCSYVAGSDTVKSFTAPAGVSKIRVYVWLEGQDCDCESAIAGSILNCGLTFSIK